MNYKILVLLLGLLFVSPAFAANLNITNPVSHTSTYVNTQDKITMLNLSFHVTESNAGNNSLNVTMFNITIPEGGADNISAIEIINMSGNVIASNNTNATNVTFKIYIPNGLVLNMTTLNNNMSTVLFSVNISPVAKSNFNFSLNISSPSDVGLEDGSHTVNITNSTTGSVRSNGLQIQDVHASATITPHSVDTNVKNQSFLFVLNVNGTNPFENITITLPANYSIVNVTEISNSTTILYNDTNQTTYLNVHFGTYTINITNFTTQSGFNSVQNNLIKINFTANTSSQPVISLPFNLTVTGSNLSSVTVTANSTDSLNVSTLVLANVTNVKLVKGTAIVNGTDYWEFNLTVNITANVSGLLQFRMNEWNSTEGHTLNLTNQTDETTARFYATFRNETLTSTVHQFNVSLAYGAVTKGLTITYTGSTIEYILRMVVPTGTPVADWRTKYFTLFRATP